MRIYVLSVLFIFTAFMPQKKTKVLFFGDSITQLGADRGGYISRIDSMCKLEGLQSRYEFIGAGISGNKVYDLYLRMDTSVLAKSPDLVFIYIGVNDVWHKALTGTGTDQDRFVKFYQAILDKLKAANIKAILCTPAVIGEKTDFSNPQDGDMNQYSQLIRNLAEKNNLQLIDLRKIFLEYNLKNNPANKESGILTRDRVHLNAAGNQLLADTMWARIKQF